MNFRAIFFFAPGAAQWSLQLDLERLLKDLKREIIMQAYGQFELVGRVALQNALRGRIAHGHRRFRYLKKHAGMGHR